MGRLVTMRAFGAKSAAAPGEPQDDALSRIAKYVPAEVLAFFAMWIQGAALLPWANARTPVVMAGAAIGLVATFVYFTRFFPGAPPEVRNAHR